MNIEVILFLAGNFITFLGYVIYAFTRFARLENEVKHIIQEVDDFSDIKQLVYKIHAQNELLLNMKVSSATIA